MVNPVMLRMLASVGFFLTSSLFIQVSDAAPRQAQYANIDYDVVYVRCPRAKEPVISPDDGRAFLNWNGVNDIWLSASNNIYQEPGCDLVLHHSNFPPGDPTAEEVLVNCDENNSALPICTIADPNVSFDGRTVVYAKFTDTRSFMPSTGVIGDGGWGKSRHFQSFMKISPDGNGPRGYAEWWGVQLKPFNAPAYIYKYDLVSGTETRISPADGFFSGRAHPGKSTEWTSNIPVMDTGPFFMADGRIGFTSNRADGFYKFQLFSMDSDGRNLQLFGHRAMSQQLHPAVLTDGRVLYTSHDVMLQKPDNNQYSLFTIGPDGTFPFIFDGKHDASHISYHFATQLSDGDVVVTGYYNHNNTGLGALYRMPVDPPGADFEHIGVVPGQWKMGVDMVPFQRKGQFKLTSQATPGDAQAKPYRENTGNGFSINDEWTHPDGRHITMMGKFSHPAAAPDNNLLATYTIGGSSQMNDDFGSLSRTREVIGKDAGIWLIPLEAQSTRRVQHIADDALLVVDSPNYHEIMPRAVVPYSRIYGITRPDPNNKMLLPANDGVRDPRLEPGSPFALSGAASMIDRETMSVNGIPWNSAGADPPDGRNYMNLSASGADLAIYGDSEIYGIRVTMPIPNVPNNYPGGVEKWARQGHHLRILGEFPVRKADGSVLDEQGNPDTSFVVKIPADTPFLFQAIDKRGMALNIETTSRSAVRGERKFCGGCHVHTRASLNPFQSRAVLETTAPYGDFSGNSAPLFSSLDTNGNPVVAPARNIYNETLAPGVNSRRSFAVDWKDGISAIMQNRCASCHAEGQSAQQVTGLRLDGDDRTYDLLVRNSYVREDGVSINSSSNPGDGLNDVINNTPGTDRITPHYECCTVSRWISIDSARSSMLVWALYGERLDGRDPNTGLPPAGSGVLVDNGGREHPEIWPKVAEHAAYLAGMPESEKRLIARWVDLGAPKLNVHDDMMRPVLTVTPVLDGGGGVSHVKLGLWDDSALDFTRFKVLADGSDITPNVTGNPSVVDVNLGIVVNAGNADIHEFTFEIWDKPDRSLSLVDPGVPAANRTRKTLTGRALLRMAVATPNAAPTSTSAQITTYQNTASSGVIPIVVDPDVDDSHFFTIISQPANGTAVVSNNRLIYTPFTDYVGADSFNYSAHDLGGLAVDGVASVTVLAGAPPGGGGNTDVGAGGGTSGADRVVITNMLPMNYVWDVLAVGATVFTDRMFTFTSVPSALQGLDFLQTSNNDKQATASNALRFDVDRPVRVFVAYDSRLALPSWLDASWSSTGLELGDTNSQANGYTKLVYQKDFPAGTVVLGGNNGGSLSSMYSVILAVQGAPSSGGSGGSASGGGAAGGGDSNTQDNQNTGTGGTSSTPIASGGSGGALGWFELLGFLLVMVGRILSAFCNRYHKRCVGKCS